MDTQEFCNSSVLVVKIVEHYNPITVGWKHNLAMHANQLGLSTISLSFQNSCRVTFYQGRSIQLKSL